MADNKKKINIKRTIKNNVYALKIIHKAAPGLILFSVVNSFLTAFAGFLGNTYILMYTLNALQEKEPLGRILITVCLILAVMLSGNVCSFFWDMFCEAKRVKLEEYVNGMIYKKAAELDLVCYETPEFLDVYIKASSEGVDRLWSVLKSLYWAVWDIVNGISNIALIATVAPVFVLLAGVPFLCTLLIGRKRNSFRHEYQMKSREVERRRDYVRRTFYLADFAKEMRLTSMWKVMFERMRTTVDELTAIQKKYGWGLMFFAYLYDQLFDVIVSTGSKALAVYMTLVSKTMLVGDCVVAVNSAENIAYGLNGIGESLLSFDEHSMYIEDIRKFLEYEIRISENSDAAKTEDFETLELKNIGFVYDSAEKPALDGIDLKIKKGEKIAIVGHNGAGKTTLVKLLLRLYDPTSGEIFYNGKDIKALRLSSYRQRFGTVFQDPRLFAVSIGENVMQKGNITDAERKLALSAIENAGLAARVFELKNGIDTTVTKEFDSEGVVFSGGEAQKLAIARVFADKCDIVIMDEPTSALDPIAEQEMYSNMFRACEGKTVIYISHRLSSAVMADHVYMFEHGKIIEHGTHSQLLALNGKYADMWHKQADTYTQGEESW